MRCTITKHGSIEHDEISGGKADNKSDSDFDPKQIAKGIKVEREHTTDPAKAKEIAEDHLTEFDHYYDALDKMEEKLKEGKTAAYGLGVTAAFSKLAASLILPGVVGGLEGAIRAPSGQRINTGVMTGAGAMGGAAAGNLVGVLADTLLAKKYKLPPFFSRLGYWGGAMTGASLGHGVARKRMWGALPRFKYEHNF